MATYSDKQIQYDTGTISVLVANCCLPKFHCADGVEIVPLFWNHHSFSFALCGARSLAAQSERA